MRTRARWMHVMIRARCRLAWHGLACMLAAATQAAFPDQENLGGSAQCPAPSAHGVRYHPSIPVNCVVEIVR